MDDYASTGGSPTTMQQMSAAETNLPRMRAFYRTKEDVSGHAGRRAEDNFEIRLKIRIVPNQYMFVILET